MKVIPYKYHRIYNYNIKKNYEKIVKCILSVGKKLIMRMKRNFLQGFHILIFFVIG